MPKAEDDPTKDIPHIQPEPRPDFGRHDQGRKLPAALQKTLDNEESSWALWTEGKGPDSTSSDVRYAAYAARVRTILLSAHRYVAYTSDIGESFRPIAHPWLIKGAYGVSWAYLIGDVGHEGYKAYLKNQETLKGATGGSAPVPPIPGAAAASSEQKAAEAAAPDPGIAATTIAAGRDLPSRTPAAIAPIDDYRTVMAKRAIFQGLASMGLPAFTIHSIVRYSGKALKNSKNTRIRSYGPIGLGLAAVPALPYLFDKPVEHAVEYVFHRGFEVVGGVGPAKEKEL